MAAAAISARPMAAKKKTIKKGKTVSLNDFLAEDGIVGSARSYPRSINWADESEDIVVGDASNAWPLDESISRQIIDRSQLPTAPREVYRPSIDKGRLPSRPPYTAFLGNLPYDVTEECIFTFFTGLKLSAVRLPRELGSSDRLKGFGYAVFDDVESLSNALALNNENLCNRRIRVDIAEQSQDKDRDDRGRDRDWARDSGKTECDWRSRNTEDFSRRNGFQPDSRTGRDCFSFSRERGRGRDEAFGTRRDCDRSRDGGERFFNGFRERDRDNAGYVDRDMSGGWRSCTSGFRRDVNDSRNDDRWLGDRPGDKFERRADYTWRADSRGEQCAWSKPEVAHGPLACDAVEEVMRPSREACASVRVEQMCCGIEATRDVPPCSADSSTEASTVLTQRPRLKLKPRSIPKEIATPPPAERSERITSIFGAARPVDTAAREREIEERLRKRGQGLKRPQSWRSNEDVGERRRSSGASDASRISRTASVGSSTGKGQQSRKESEAYGGDEVFSRQDEAQLFKSAQQQPPGPKVVPAPPPRENAWVKRSEMQNRQPIQQQLLPADSAQTSLNNLKTRVPNSAVESNTSTFPDKIIQVALEDSGNEDADWQPEVLAPTKPKQLGVKIKHGSSRSKGRGRGVIAVKKDHKRKESQKELYSTKPKKYEEWELPNFSSESTFAALRTGGDLDEAN